MSWIVRDAVVRYRLEYGTYQWHQWWACIQDIGCEMVWLSAKDRSRGYIIGRRIFIRRGMSPKETAQVAWHECGHALLHAGSPQMWSEWAGGSVMLRKAERQANEFADLFPIWDTPKGARS